MIDMRLDDNYQLAVQANGDAALISGDDCFMQTLRIEAASSEGDLWYDPDWGWSLLDFGGRQQDELVELEVEQRVRQKLRQHEEIDVGSIDVTASWSGDAIGVTVRFRRLGSDELRQLNVNIGRTEIEVITIA